MSLRSGLAVLCAGLFVPMGATRALAQAPIDPSLPEAPLPHNRAFALFPGFDVVQQTTTPIPPLRAGQKYELAFRTIADVSLPVRAGITTVYDHSVGVGPFYGPGAAGFGKLYAYNAANLAASFFFADAVIPSLAHQDPRYFRKGSGPVRSRIWWALRSEFVAFSDRGRQMPNYGNMAGLGMSALLSDAYLPARNVSVANTFEAYGIKLGTTWALNVLHEYGGVAKVKKILQQQTDKLAQHDDAPPP